MDKKILSLPGLGLLIGVVNVLVNLLLMSAP